MTKKRHHIAGNAASGSNALNREDALLNSALAFHQNGNLPQAERAYRDLLSVNPRHVGALNYLGVLAHQIGRAEDGIDLIKKALEITKRNPELHFNLALIYSSLGSDEEAVFHNKKALKIKPDYADAHTNLGILMLRQGDAATAVLHFSRALIFKPSSAARENAAKALLANGSTKEALSVLAKGLSEDDCESLRTLFALVVRSMSPSDVPDDARFHLFLLRAIKEAWCRPRDLSGIAGKLLLGMPPVDQIASRIADALPADELLQEGDLAALGDNKLLNALLTETPNSIIEIELILTSLRRVFLDRTTAGMEVQEPEPLILKSALAFQCFTNEYVFAVTESEMEKTTKLREIVSQTLDSGRPIAPGVLVTVACYFPLNSISGAERLTKLAWPDPIQRLIKQQIVDPLEERATQSTVRRLTSVTDETSRLVREQYEQNPYPRWLKTFVSKQPVSIDHYIRTRFPHARYRNIDDGKLDLLIAGCGTGMHAIERTAQFAVQSVLAIDLSLASLSYAIRKTGEFGLSKLEYAQADITAVSGMDRTFDIIDSSGVLHHLREPLDGWRNLLGLLRPGGLMHIGLYSSTARQDVSAARELIAHENLDSSATSIRTFRQRLMHLKPGDPFENLVRSNSFFTISECRDLLFHVQEHQFDIAQIAAFLDANDLDFLGFETMATDRYRKRFPDDKAAANLANWQLFEAENPLTFAEMYQFWIQKRI